MELPRSTPIRPTLHSKSIRIRYFNFKFSDCPDANELYFENMKLTEDIEHLKKNYENL